MRRIFGIGVVAACAAALLVNGLGPADARTVTSTEFTKQVCAAIATADQSAKASAATLSAAAKAYKSAPSPTTAVALRDALTQTAQALDTQFGTILTSIQQAGTPPNAAEFVAALSSELQAQRAAAQRIVQHAAAVDTTSAAAFATSLQAVVDETKAEGKLSRASAKKNPSFKSAPRAVRPLVRVMTTKANTCGKI